MRPTAELATLDASAADRARLHQVVDTLVGVGVWLQGRGYRFVTVTPETQRRVLARDPDRVGTDARDVFGWSRPFEIDAGIVPTGLAASLREAGLLWPVGTDGLWRSRVRFSTRGAVEGSAAQEIYAHSAYPTDEADAVFFGPDTYRFCRFIEQAFRRDPPPAGARVLDMGCGSGVGGLVAVRAAPASAAALTLADVNPMALAFARANRRLAPDIESAVRFALGDLYAAVDGAFDRIVSNPPYLLDAGARTYRHGGGDYGEGLAERIAIEGVPRLAPGGSILLYTGAAVVDGRFPLVDALRPRLAAIGAGCEIEEIDPDVFGEELSSPAYVRCERIAALGITVRAAAGRAPR